jgi:hypothetical protein
VAALSGFGAAADGLDGFGVSHGVSGPGSLTLDLWFEPAPVIDALSPKNGPVLTPDWGHVGCWDRERLNRRSGQRASLLVPILIPGLHRPGRRTDAEITTKPA